MSLNTCSCDWDQAEPDCVMWRTYALFWFVVFLISNSYLCLKVIRLCHKLDAHSIGAGK